MKPFCITYVEEILPVVKAMIARKMLFEFKLSQVKVAEILEMTQPAISQYKRSLRGRKSEILEKDEKTLELINDITRKLALGELTEEERGKVFCRICKSVQRNAMI